jgi:hypothetical protein
MINAVIVIDAREFLIERLPTRFQNRQDHFARLRHGKDLIGVAVKAPARQVFETHRFVRLPAVTDRHDRRPTVQFGRGKMDHVAGH